MEVNLISGGKVADQIASYFAMRKISTRRDENGIVRLLLNNKDYFQFGPLDQGWWPDGLYTAPCDEALKYDIQKTKEFGFKMIRKHVKVEPAAGTPLRPTRYFGLAGYAQRRPLAPVAKPPVF
jgi:hypothetical protein